MSESGSIARQPYNGEIELTFVGKAFIRAPDAQSFLWLDLRGNAVHIDTAKVAPENRGQGVAIAMYEKAIAFAERLGLPLRSDNRVSFDAMHVYESLQRRGYQVQKMPTTIDMVDGTPIGYRAVGCHYVFEVRSSAGRHCIA